MPPGEEEPRVFRVGGVSYLRIPAEDPRRSAAFYEAVFGWSVRGERDDPSFEDGTGHVIGHFVADLRVAGEAGVRPYIFVERVDETLDKAVGHGGDVVTAPYPEGDLWVATFRDRLGTCSASGSTAHATRLNEIAFPRSRANGGGDDRLAHRG